MPKETGEFLFYQTDDGKTRLQVNLSDQTVWLSLNQMAELFDRDKSSISKHIANIFEEDELMRDRTVANFATVRTEGSRNVERNVEYYNLDVIISVGYRVKSQRGTQFRVWATERLREYIIKGFTMDDERLKSAEGGNYFDELLARIRDIRSSEKIFWKKVLDIYTTSIDYDAKNNVSIEFFKIIQNKMHWAAHGHTIAKNYLDASELDLLNRIVSFYLEFAEFQAMQQKAMYMKDWIKKLDDFLKLSERDILTNAGKISHEIAMNKANQEFDKYHQEQLNEPSQAEKDFEETIKMVQMIEKEKAKKQLARLRKTCKVRDVVTPN